MCWFLEFDRLTVISHRSHRTFILAWTCWLKGCSSGIRGQSTSAVNIVTGIAPCLQQYESYDQDITKIREPWYNIFPWGCETRAGGTGNHEHRGRCLGGCGWATLLKGMCAENSCRRICYYVILQVCLWYRIRCVMNIWCTSTKYNKYDGKGTSLWSFWTDLETSVSTLVLNKDVW